MGVQICFFLYQVSSEILPIKTQNTDMISSVKTVSTHPPNTTTKLNIVLA